MKKFFFGSLIAVGFFVTLIYLARGGFPLISFMHRLHHLGEATSAAPDKMIAMKFAPTNSSVSAPSATEEDFGGFLREVSQTLPDLAKIRGSGRDLSHAPTELHDVAVQLGKISDQIHENPDLISQALSFFEDCTRREDTLSAVRAVCLWNLRKFTAQINRPGLLDESAYPESIRNLADNLPTVR